MLRPLCALCLSAALLEAQSVRGRVFDATDSLVVSGAQVRLDGEHATRSGGLGAYVIANVDPGSHVLSVRMLGYAAASDSVDVPPGQTVERDIYLTRVPRLLSTTVVKGQSLRVPAGFESVYRRAAAGQGYFVARERIDSLNPRDLTALLHEFPFLHVNANPRAPDRLSTSRCAAMLPGSNMSGQSITVFLNGTPITDAMVLDELLRHTSPAMIQAVEFYNGALSVPQIYRPACAAIGIWTRSQ